MKPCMYWIFASAAVMKSRMPAEEIPCSSGVLRGRDGPLAKHMPTHMCTMTRAKRFFMDGQTCNAPIGKVTRMERPNDVTILHRSGSGTAWHVARLCEGRGCSAFGAHFWGSAKVVPAGATPFMRDPPLPLHST